MEIYQPMFYVGLGGTGCQVGAELERRLREELCGPDGTALQETMRDRNFLPYQLPSCLQFVYADLSEDEYERLEQRVVPDPEYLPAAGRTLHIVRDLVPQHDTYSEVARSLRLSAAQYVNEWLPPPDGEPRIGGLARGAGQLPTIGRAALFETFRSGLAPAQDPLFKAIGAINNSAGELNRLGGRLRKTCDVFVAFSVAGGTGGGLFYDYLHLIGDALARNGYRAKIYPLVLMPSAFQDGLGGGRPARLNAGRALLDLFRLVDDQNTQVAGDQLDDTGISGSLAVQYPDRAEIRLRASTVQTAFLFSMGAGVRRDDLHRSVVSLVLSLIGTDIIAAGDVQQPTDRTYQSFADSFINGSVERESPAQTGIGSRGVSTSSVASMTVPVDELADIISSRLLAAAVTELTEPPPGVAENNRKLIEQFFTDANLDPLRLRAPVPIKEPPGAVDAVGANAIVRMLKTRERTMQGGLQTLEQQLRQSVPELAQAFDPQRAVRSALTTVDLFRLRRVVTGHAQLDDEADRLGFIKIVEARRGEPVAPEGLTMAPPPPRGIDNKMLGLARIKWSAPAVRESLARQNEWYAWRAQRCWHAAWDKQVGQWEGRLRALDNQLARLVEAFAEHARTDDARFTSKGRELYRSRVGVSYLLPRHGDLEPFYQAVVRRFVEYHVAQGQLSPTATVGAIVSKILGGTGWLEAYKTSIDRTPMTAVGQVRDRIKRAVLQLFAYHSPEHAPLLPALQDLLAASAGHSSAPVEQDDLAQFRQKLAGLVPGGFAPAGTGRLKILLSYPASAKDQELEKFLRQEVNLPSGSDTVVEFRPINAESIVVVLFRTAMGLTEVPEVREVLRYWSDALRNESRQDFLRWRQRVGYNFGYLATTAEHRAQILHHLLCAAWNGYITTTGDPASPSAVNVHLGDASVNMRLDLVSYADQSSWSSALSAYEKWVLADDEQIRRDFCARLTATLPEGLDSSPLPAVPLFETLLELERSQPKELDELLARTPAKKGRRRQLEWLREFWTETFPAAMVLPFHGVINPVEDNLRDLYERMGQ